MNITVDLGARSYDVAIGDGVRSGLADLIAKRAPMAQVAVIVTSPSLRAQPWFDFETGITQHVLEVPEGEDAKTLESLSALLENIAKLGLSRNDVLVAVGGGAITDLGGFAAASYLRGIGLINISTSVAGQVDAAIGGKTGVNLSAGKNLVGAFHQPLGVYCDFETIATLPDRERLAGMGEVAKCWLLEGKSARDLSSQTSAELTTMAVALKARIVSGDEREGGERALLNYGHTFGHALEVLSLAKNKDALRHGEAVAIGLSFAAHLAHALGRVGADVIDNHNAVLDFFGLSYAAPRDFSVDALLEAMSHDKKAHHDLTFVLLGAKGFEVVPGIDRDVVAKTIESFRG
jgi:5-deoxy-5-amino-3-dehydroquinate synthase